MYIRPLGTVRIQSDEAQDLATFTVHPLLYGNNRCECIGYFSSPMVSKFSHLSKRWRKLIYLGTSGGAFGGVSPAIGVGIVG